MRKARTIVQTLKIKTRKGGVSGLFTWPQTGGRTTSEWGVAGEWLDVVLPH